MTPARWWPRSLFGRVALIVCGGLALAHALTFWILQREREAAGLSMMGGYVGQDVATAVAVLDRVPAAERAAWLPRLARLHYRYTLEPAPPGTPPAGAWAEGLAQAIGAALGPARAGAATQQPDGALAVPLHLAGGGLATLHVTPPTPRVSRASTVLLVLQFVALAGAAWWAVRLAVRPLARLAAAADALVPGGMPADVGDPAAPREVRQAAAAFEAMRRRIEAQLAERMQLLAAISHDLQSPITRMRLRVEGVEDGALRDRLQADLASMQSLVEEGLAYARSAHAAQEVSRPVDLRGLLHVIVCDAVDAGHRVTLDGTVDSPVVTRVLALQRVVTNLVDNAVKFGGGAEVVLTATAAAIEVRVRDRGPGIPPDQLAAVLRPFHRVEDSRNRETGGTGLGLAIAHQLASVLGGTLTLANRDGGGLDAVLRLPRAA